MGIHRWGAACHAYIAIALEDALPETIAVEQLVCHGAPLLVLPVELVAGLRR